MALTPTLVGETVFGNMRVLYGTYAITAGSTSGTLTVGLNGIYSAQANSSATTAYPTGIAWSSGTMTIYANTSDSGGYWMLYGY